MNKVIIVNLNNNTYPLDEEGYNALRAYINRAEAQLRTSDDKREVMSDLEQAIADKCASYLKAHKNLVTAAEVAQILNEIGPVQSADGQPVDIEPPEVEAPSTSKTEARNEAELHRRQLYRIREGSKLTGVCTGLAAYADVDVGNVRGLFMIAAACGGIGFFIYAVMVFVVPVAYTDAQLAAAHSRPPNLRHC